MEVSQGDPATLWPQVVSTDWGFVDGSCSRLDCGDCYSYYPACCLGRFGDCLVVAKAQTRREEVGEEGEGDHH